MPDSPRRHLTNRTSQRSFLQSDLAAVSALLPLVPNDDAHVLDRLSLQSRIDQVQDELRELEREAEATGETNLRFFHGDPTVEKHEIDAIDEPIPGTFLGVLLDSRRFEHKALESGEVLRGKVAEDVDLGDLLQWTGKDCVAHMQVVTLARGLREQRRYMLTRLVESEP